MNKELCAADYDFVWFDEGDDNSQDTMDKNDEKPLENYLDEQIKEVLDSSTNMLI